jgi:putative tryptophan/tyrosine transport system substrate-binding protein
MRRSVAFLRRENVIFIDFFLWHTHCGGRGKAMNKKLFWLVTFLVLVAGTFTEAQQPNKFHRIGYLASSDPGADSARAEAIRLALRDLGYIEGQNIAIEYRYGEGKRDRLAEVAAELVRLKVNVIVVAGGASPIRAAINATKTIPIVLDGSGTDPVRAGYVESLVPSRRQRHRPDTPYQRTRR